MLPRPFSIVARCLPLLMLGAGDLRAQSPSDAGEQRPPARVEAPAEAAYAPTTTGSLPPVGGKETEATAVPTREPLAGAAQDKAATETPTDNTGHTAAPSEQEKPAQGKDDASAAPPTSPPVALDPAPGGDGEPDPLTPKERAEPAPAAPGTPAATAAPAASAAAPSDPAVVVPDPAVTEILKQLAGASASGRQRAQADDRATLKSFYESPGAKPVWTTPSGFNERALQAIAELRRADDWGLKASDYQIPTLSGGAAEPHALAAAEIGLGLAVLAYARHARGGRIDPTSISKLIDRRPRIYDPNTVIQAIAAAPVADAYLRSLHPKHPQFEKLRQALLVARNPNQSSKAESARPIGIPDGPLLRPGARHAQVAIVRQRLSLPAGDDPEVYDDAMVAAVEAYQREHGMRVDGLVGPGVRSAMNGKPRPSRGSDIARLVVNMERWRWMPDDLGEFHVWASVTEQRTSVVKRGEVVFSEKIVVGKPNTPTPSFSADMKFVIFHPTWGVPNGIKTNELAPHLRRAAPSNDFFFFGGGGYSASRVLQRFGGLVPTYNGRPVDPDSVDWSRVDISRFSFTQPAGPRNVLGVVKFRFPNKHDVYMHDTPERHLFNGPSRAFSHGCMRVQNPMRMAEVILDYDRGWSRDRVHSMVDARSSTTDVTLEKRVPVHIAYFTAIAEDSGGVRYVRDLYGLDSRVASALEGRRVEVSSRAEPTAEVEPSSSEEAPRRSADRRRAIQRRQQRAPLRSSDNPFAGLFQW